MRVYFCGLDHIPPGSWLLSVNTQRRQHPANTGLAISAHQFTYLTYTLSGPGHVRLIWKMQTEKMMVFDILKEVIEKCIDCIPYR